MEDCHSESKGYTEIFQKRNALKSKRTADVGSGGACRNMATDICASSH